MASHDNDAHLNELQLHVQGMHCSNCAAAVERRLKALPQVRHVKVDYPAGRALVKHSGAIDIGDLQKVMADDGYTVSVAAGGS